MTSTFPPITNFAVGDMLEPAHLLALQTTPRIYADRLMALHGAGPGLTRREHEADWNTAGSITLVDGAIGSGGIAVRLEKVRGICPDSGRTLNIQAPVVLPVPVRPSDISDGAFVLALAAEGVDGWRLVAGKGAADPDALPLMRVCVRRGLAEADPDFVAPCSFVGGSAALAEAVAAITNELRQALARPSHHPHIVDARTVLRCCVHAVLNDPRSTPRRWFATLDDCVRDLAALLGTAVGPIADFGAAAWRQGHAAAIATAREAVGSLRRHLDTFADAPGGRVSATRHGVVQGFVRLELELEPDLDSLTGIAGARLAVAADIENGTSVEWRISARTDNPSPLTYAHHGTAVVADGLVQIAFQPQPDWHEHRRLTLWMQRRAAEA